MFINNRHGLQLALQFFLATFIYGVLLGGPVNLTSLLLTAAIILVGDAIRNEITAVRRSPYAVKAMAKF